MTSARPHAGALNAPTQSRSPESWKLRFPWGLFPRCKNKTSYQYHTFPATPLRRNLYFNAPELVFSRVKTNRARTPRERSLLSNPFQVSYSESTQLTWPSSTHLFITAGRNSPQHCWDDEGPTGGVTVTSTFHKQEWSGGGFSGTRGTSRASL